MGPCRPWRVDSRTTCIFLGVNKLRRKYARTTSGKTQSMREALDYGETMTKPVLLVNLDTGFYRPNPQFADCFHFEDNPLNRVREGWSLDTIRTD